MSDELEYDDIASTQHTEIAKRARMAHKISNLSGDVLPFDLSALPDFFRPVTQKEIEALLYRCPFLQCIGPELPVESRYPDEPRFIEAQSGWKIFDYADALSTSFSDLFVGDWPDSLSSDFSPVEPSSTEPAVEDDDEGSGGQGTLFHQAIITAEEIIEIAHRRGWGAVLLIDGHPLMKRAAWLKANALGILFNGFEPTDEDRRAYANQMRTGNRGSATQKQRPK